MHWMQSKLSQTVPWAVETGTGQLSPQGLLFLSILSPMAQHTPQIFPGDLHQPLTEQTQKRGGRIQHQPRLSGLCCKAATFSIVPPLAPPPKLEDRLQMPSCLWLPLMPSFLPVNISCETARFLPLSWTVTSSAGPELSARGQTSTWNLLLKLKPAVGPPKARVRKPSPTSSQGARQELHSAPCPASSRTCSGEGRGRKRAYLGCA